MQRLERARSKVLRRRFVRAFGNAAGYEVEHHALPLNRPGYSSAIRKVSLRPQDILKGPREPICPAKRMHARPAANQPSAQIGTDESTAAEYEKAHAVNLAGSTGIIRSDLQGG